MSLMDLSELNFFVIWAQRVIKVEPPGHGDDTRTFGPYVDGQSLYYSFINHGKESVVLDLKNDHDKSIFINMLKQADVLAENFRPVQWKNWGFHGKRFKKSTRASYMLHRQVSDIPVR